MKIEMLGSPVLRQKAAEVTQIDDGLRTLVADMFETMYAAEGIGLAGPQVAVPKRVIVVDVKAEATTRVALVNPRVVERSKAQEKEEEGCLSIPGVSAHVERSIEVVVEALDEEGHPVRIEADGLLARCLQHEIDHLDGILFIDRLPALKRSMVVKKYRAQLAEEVEAVEKAAARRRA
ncbi:MAG TPA: peptide deformylase [Longimicrobiaceae bacterium]|nr:peptide deformylase [Longimicrobiaceae bacterium]